MKKNIDYIWLIRSEEWFLAHMKKNIELATLPMIARGYESYNFPVIKIEDVGDLIYVTELDNRTELFARLKGSDDFDCLWDSMKNKLKLMVRNNITKNNTEK